MSSEQSAAATKDGEQSGAAPTPAVREAAAPAADGSDERGAGSALRTRRGLHPGTELLVVAMLAGLIIERTAMDAGPDIAARVPQLAAGYGVLLFLLTLALGLRSRWRAALSSQHFGVLVLAVGTAATALGTVVLQRLSPEQFRETYGAVAPVLAMLGLQDLFHGLPFAALVGLCAGGLLLALTRRRPRTVRRWGAVLSHAGIVLVFAGAAVGSFWGLKGRIWLREGQSTTDFRVSEPAAMAGQQRPLGFRLTLKDFELQNYEPRFRVQVFEHRGEQSELLASVDPSAAGEAARASLAELGVTLGEYWADHATETSVTALEGPGAGVAALGLRASGADDAAPRWLLDRDGPGGRLLDAGSARLSFFWSEERAAEYRQTLDGTPAARHTVRLASGESLAVAPGGRYPLGTDGRAFRVLRFFNDFTYDTQSKTPVDRSAQPRNPAIEVALLDAAGQVSGRTWLFAKFPAFHGSGPGQPGAGMTYVFHEGAGARAEEWIAVGQTAELWQVSGGEIAARQPLAAGAALRLDGQAFTVAGLHERARVEHRDVSRSEVARNPVARISVGGRERTLRPGNPLRLADGKVLVLRSIDEDTPKDFISTLAAAGEGGEAREQRIEVNDPLVFGGLQIYQSDYDPDDHTVSGFQVVRDPGLWLVYLGLGVCMLGVGLVVFVAPGVDRRRRAA